MKAYMFKHQVCSPCSGVLIVGSMNYNNIRGKIYAYMFKQQVSLTCSGVLIVGSMNYHNIRGGISQSKTKLKSIVPRSELLGRNFGEVNERFIRRKILQREM